MAVTLALRAGCSLPPGRFVVLISVRGWVDPRAVVRLERLGQKRNSIILCGIEPATFLLLKIHFDCLTTLSSAWSVSDFWPQTSGFTPRVVYMGFVVDEVAPGQVSLLACWCSSVSYHPADIPCPYLRLQSVSIQSCHTR
jgi:hypothetical protein